MAASNEENAGQAKATTGRLQFMLVPQSDVDVRAFQLLLIRTGSQSVSQARCSSLHGASEGTDECICLKMISVVAFKSFLFILISPLVVYIRPGNAGRTR